MIYIKFKKLSPTATTPTKGSQEAAGFDLYADTDTNIYIKPGEIRMIQTGISAEIPPGYFGGVYARSGLSTNRGLTLINGVGVVDSDYRGGICVPLINLSKSTQMIKAHERVGQLVVQPFADVRLYEVTELSKTDRGSGGFGSTGRL